MSSCGGKKMEKGGKVTTPEKEKKRIKDLAKKERMKKILTEDMKTFGPKEESKPVKKKAGGMLKKPDNPGLKKLPTEVRNKMGYMKKGGKVGYKKGGSVKHKGDGICVRGKTKGRMV